MVEVLEEEGLVDSQYIMKTKSKTLLLTVLVLVLSIGVVASVNNSLIRKEIAIETRYADVDTAYRLRSNKISQIVDVVGLQVKHEEKVFISLAEARTGLDKALKEKDTQSIIESNKELTQGLNSIIVSVEAYPELASSQSFITLIDEISGAENRINYAITEYNTSVSKYNMRIKTFPTSLIANMLNHTTKDMLISNETERPNIDF